MDTHSSMPGVEVKRDGRREPFLRMHPGLSSVAAHWTGFAVEDYSTPACVIHRHEHVDNFVHVVLHGSSGYEVVTRGKSMRFSANPGTTFILPQGTVDELRWDAPVHRVAVAIHPTLLANAQEHTAHRGHIELIEKWDLTDPHIMAVLVAMITDLQEGSPAGRLYGESLGNALAVYLVKRYGATGHQASVYGGGLSGYCLKRVLEYIADHLADDLALAELAMVAGMSAHHFATMFRRSTGQAPHQYVLQQRIERAKEHLRVARGTVIDAGLEAGFGNPSHFARTFRRFVGMTPSRFRSESRSR
jgi:AraC family transcriptional regulator